MKEHFVFPPDARGHEQSRRQKTAFFTSRDKKGCKEECSSGVKF